MVWQPVFEEENSEFKPVVQLDSDGLHQAISTSGTLQESRPSTKPSFVTQYSRIHTHTHTHTYIYIYIYIYIGVTETSIQDSTTQPGNMFIYILLTATESSIHLKSFALR